MPPQHLFIPVHNQSDATPDIGSIEVKSVHVRSQQVKSPTVEFCLVPVGSRQVKMAWVISGQKGSHWVHSGHVRSTQVTSDRQVTLGNNRSRQGQHKSIQGLKQVSRVHSGQIRACWVVGSHQGRPG